MLLLWSLFFSERNRDIRVLNNWLKVALEVTECDFKPREPRSRICILNMLLFCHAQDFEGKEENEDIQ